MSGARMLVECLVREGVDCMFGIPGGVTIPFYDVLYDCPIRTCWCATRKTPRSPRRDTRAPRARWGCAAPPRAGGDEPRHGAGERPDGLDSDGGDHRAGVSNLIGSDAFQEADTFGITRSCTKHNYLVKRLEDLPSVVHEAFYVAASGRPGRCWWISPRTYFRARGTTSR